MRECGRLRGFGRFIHQAGLVTRAQPSRLTTTCSRQSILCKRMGVRRMVPASTGTGPLYHLAVRNRRIVRSHRGLRVTTSASVLRPASALRLPEGGFPVIPASHLRRVAEASISSAAATQRRALAAAEERVSAVGAKALVADTPVEVAVITPSGSITRALPGLRGSSDYGAALPSGRRVSLHRKWLRIRSANFIPSNRYSEISRSHSILQSG